MIAKNASQGKLLEIGGGRVVRRNKFTAQKSLKILCISRAIHYKRNLLGSLICFGVRGRGIYISKNAVGFTSPGAYCVRNERQ